MSEIKNINPGILSLSPSPLGKLILEEATNLRDKQSALVELKLMGSDHSNTSIKIRNTPVKPCSPTKPTEEVVLFEAQEEEVVPEPNEIKKLKIKKLQTSDTKHTRNKSA